MKPQILHSSQPHWKRSQKGHEIKLMAEKRDQILKWKRVRHPAVTLSCTSLSIYPDLWHLQLSISTAIYESVRELWKKNNIAVMRMFYLSPWLSGAAGWKLWYVQRNCQQREGRYQQGSINFPWGHRYFSSLPVPANACCMRVHMPAVCTG